MGLLSRCKCELCLKMYRQWHGVSGIGTGDASCPYYGTLIGSSRLGNIINRCARSTNPDITTWINSQTFDEKNKVSAMTAIKASAVSPAQIGDRSAETPGWLLWLMVGMQSFFVCH